LIDIHDRRAYPGGNAQLRWYIQRQWYWRAGNCAQRFDKQIVASTQRFLLLIIKNTLDIMVVVDMRQFEGWRIFVKYTLISVSQVI